jgi:hypothetical protein
VVRFAREITASPPSPAALDAEGARASAACRHLAVGFSDCVFAAGTYKAAAIDLSSVLADDLVSAIGQLGLRAPANTKGALFACLEAHFSATAVRNVR